MAPRSKLPLDEKSAMRSATAVPVFRSRVRAALGGPRGPGLFRFCLIFMSAAGMVAGAVLWATGHAHQAARVVAGDVLLLAVLICMR